MWCENQLLFECVNVIGVCETFVEKHHGIFLIKFWCYCHASCNKVVSSPTNVSNAHKNFGNCEFAISWISFMVSSSYGLIGGKQLCSPHWYTNLDVPIYMCKSCDAKANEIECRICCGYLNHTPWNVGIF